MKKYLIDSSCWIEIFTQGPQSGLCEKYLDKKAEILVPTLVIYEVYKKILVKASEDQALSAISFLSQNTTLDLDRDTALLAADLSIEYRLAMADSIVLAHSKTQEASLITRDYDFHGIPDVVVIK